MTYQLNIMHVDGSTVLGCSSTDVEVIHTFLKTHDHEGSGVQLTVVGDDDDAYSLLSMCEAHE